MSCINKSNKNYKDLAERYGDSLAASFVRGNILNKKLDNADDFYIPNIKEVKTYFRDIRKSQKQKEILDALKLNPVLNIDAIKVLLQGVVTLYNGNFYVVQGTNNRGPIERQLTLREIYEPNLKIVEKLSEEYPNIFELQSKRGPTVTEVKITPATEAEYVPDIEQSIATYTNLVNENLGVQPNSFLEGDHFWQRVGNNLYTLIDTETGEPFLRNINLRSGAEQPIPTTPVNKENANAEIMDIRANYDNDYWQTTLGLQGYNLDQIINNLETAETQFEFDEQLADFLKIIC